MHRIVPLSLTMLLIAAFGLLPTTAAMQFHDPDDEAVEAFTQMIEAYRERAAFTVESVVEVELEHDGLRASSGKHQATFTLGKGPRGVAHIREFTCYLSPGEMIAVHKDNDEAYLRSTDDTPYRAMTDAFIDLPFPHLAIMFGHDDPLELARQFHPKAPWARPTGLEAIERAGDDRTVIHMTSEHEDMQVVIDPDTKLIQSISLHITGGHFAPEGVNVMYHHAFSYELHDPDEIDNDAMFAFEPGERRRVDTLSALQPQRTADRDRRGIGGGLTGGEAPDVTLPTMDGDVFSLADHEGDVIILDFWATWCAPCLRTIPELHEVAEWAEEKHHPVTIMAVNVWEVTDAGEQNEERRLERAKAFWNEHEFTLPVAMDYDDTVARNYRLQGIPTTVVIRGDGIVQMEHVGIENYADVLKRAVREALREDDFE